MPKIIVTGGSGYIGSHTTVDLIERGYDVICIDNFMNSYENALVGIAKITGRPIVTFNVDVGDEMSLDEVFQKHHDAIGIIHFAALKAVGESVEKPLLYFKNNVGSLLNICEAAVKYSIPNIIFSSSCTVYGQPSELPVTEDYEFLEAASPYGRSKQICEWILKDLAPATSLNIISLRYFNPGGAHPSALIGEASKVPAANLIPVITETAIGKRSKCRVFGSDYPTRDGSCIRDYIHIMDLARAHTLAMDYQLNAHKKGSYEAFNLGTGSGVTVLEAIHAFEQIAEKPLNYEVGDRRPGDIVAIYSNYDKAQKILGWEPKRNINDIMASAWKWEKERTY